MELKAGAKTSEFWLSILALGLGITEFVAMPTWAMAVIPTVYTLARAWAKKQ